MIKAVLFDFDGVLTTDATGSQSICNYICKETGVDKELFKSEYRKYNDGLLYGKLKHEDIWDKVCDGIGKKISIDILKASFINTPINYEMLDLVKEIKARAYKTAMVTDNKADRIEKIANYFNMNSIFDAIVVSANIGSGKDSKEIFLQTIEKLEVDAAECVFIDNQKKNLIIPKELGMETIFYNHIKKNTGEVLEKLRNLNISI